MMNSFEFETDSKSDAFCKQIALKMVELFGISLEEATSRINRDWRGMKLIDPNDVMYHETSTYWANTIYYGAGSYWWLKPLSLKARPL